MRGVARSVQIGEEVCKCSADRSRGLLSDEYRSLEMALVVWKMGRRDRQGTKAPTRKQKSQPYRFQIFGTQSKLAARKA
jgi:hypothetical protein